MGSYCGRRATLDECFRQMGRHERGGSFGSLHYGNCDKSYQGPRTTLWLWGAAVRADFMVSRSKECGTSWPLFDRYRKVYSGSISSGRLLFSGSDFSTYGQEQIAIDRKGGLMNKSLVSMCCLLLALFLGGLYSGRMKGAPRHPT